MTIRYFELFMIRHLLLCISLVVLPTLARAQYEFIENLGQWNKEVLFKTKIDAGEVYLEKDGIRFFFYDGEKMSDFHLGDASDSVLDCHALKIEFQESNEPSQILKSVEGSTLYNFYLGKNKRKWVQGAKSFEKIVLKDLYEGIDFELYSYQHKLKYNFYVHPGADPSQIKMRYRGADDVLEQHGNIEVMTSLRTVIEEQPYAFQKDKDGTEREVLTRFKLDGDLLRFDIKGSYQKERVLVIDPSVVFATYSGSAADNFGYTATFDDIGNAYSGGTVYSFGFPVTFGAFQLVWQGGTDVNTGIGDIERDIGILKYSEDGSKLLYATLLGGTHNEDPHSMVVNSKDELLVFGNTGSDDFPTTLNAYDTTYSGKYDIYVSKFSVDGGRLLASTYLGGSAKDGLNGNQYFHAPSGKIRNFNPLGYNYGDLYRGEVIVDKNDNVYLISTSLSDDFPTSTDAFQSKRAGKHDGVVAKFDKNLSKLLAATYFGGKEQDAGYGLALNRKNELIVCGGTQGFMTFPNKAYQDKFQGGLADGVVLKLGVDLDTLKSGTYFGTKSYDQTYLIQVDVNNGIYVTGQTKDANFMLKVSKYVQKGGKQFIAKLDPSLDSIIFSSTFGGPAFFPKLSPSAFLVDQCGRIYFSGWGGGANTVGSTDSLPVSDPSIAEKTTTDNADFYLAIFGPNMDSLEYGSYFGGNNSAEHVDGGTSRYSRSAIVYQSVCAGCGAGSSDDFPVTAGVVGPKNGTSSRCNNALFKLDFESPVLYADFEIPEYACFESTITPENRSINPISYEWDFGDGDTSKRANPTHTYADTGWYTLRLIVTNPKTCPGKDTISKELYIYGFSDARFAHIGDDCLRNYEFTHTGNLAQTFNWSLGDGWYSNYPGVMHLYQNPGTYTVRLITDSGTACADTSTVQVISAVPGADFVYEPDSCEAYVNFKDRSERAVTWEWELEPGVYSTQDNPDYFYPSPGKYSVILRINKDKPCFDSIVKIIDVQPVFRKAKFGVEVDSCSYLVELKDSSTFIDGVKWITNEDTLKFPSKIYQYPAAKTYDIKLIVDPFSLCPDTTVRTIEFEGTSVASFGIGIDSCLSRAFVTNKSTGANSYSWYSEGQESQRFEPVFYYGDTGSYSITLVTNKHSICADTITENFILDHVKLAQFSSDVTECSFEVVFENESLNATQFDWDFGNGDKSQLRKPGAITYKKPGEYDVQLIIDRTKSDCSDTFETTITINEIPQADFTYKTQACNSAVGLKNESSNFSKTTWTFNNSVQSNDESLTWKFESLGEKTVHLVIEDDLGCLDSLTQTIIIDSLSNASFEPIIDSCAGTLSLFNTSTDASINEWNINGEVVSDKKNQSLWFIGEGETEIDILLTINDSTLCEDSSFQSIAFTPFQIEELFIPNILTANGDGKNDFGRILGIPDACEQVSIKIFNRWGQMVYEYVGADFLWDATTYVDTEYANSTFYYILEIDDEHRSGTFTVVR